jgi:hypothetical protein
MRVLATPMTRRERPTGIGGQGRRCLDLDFNAAEEVLADVKLKAVFKLAIDAGCAIVER